MFHKSVQLLFVITCWGGLAFIGVQTWRSPTTHTTENRALTAKPELPQNRHAIAAYVRQLESWWSDGVHYRQYFVGLSTQLRMKLGIHSQGEVLIGKNGWLFWTGEYSGEAFRNNRPLTSDELDSWRKYLVFRHRDAEKQGAKYVFIVMPNKEAAYAEFMPDNFTRLGKQTWLDQIIEAVQHDGVSILDLRHALEEGKKQAQIYNRHDTHWNLRGANYAQYEISRFLQPAFPQLNPYLYPADAFYDAPLTDFMQTNIQYYAGLSQMLAAKGQVDDLQPLFKKSITECARPARIPLQPFWEALEEPQRSNTFNATSCAAGNYRVLFFRDSFADLLKHYLSEQFRYIAYVWTPRPNDEPTWSYFIKEIRPDIVLDEVIDRYLLVIPRAGIDYPESFTTETLR